MRQVALVTGASRGIGRAVALELGRAGYAVCVNYLNSRQAAQEVTETLRSEGCDAVAIQADVADGAAGGGTGPPWRTWSARRKRSWDR